MRKLILATCSVCLLTATLATAESFYCTPEKGGKYTCEPAGEIRYYPNGKQSASSFDGFSDKFRCRKEGEKWVCVPFDKGAIILEPPHICVPSSGAVYVNPV